MAARWREGGLLAVHAAAFVGAAFLVLTPWQAAAFLAVHQAVFGFYMDCSFAPNHKGMPPLTEAEESDYLRRQVLTSRNVRGGGLTDWLLGGLNYQARWNTTCSRACRDPTPRRAQPLVQRFWAEWGVRYEQTGLFDSYAQVLRHLHDVPERTAARLAVG